MHGSPLSGHLDERVVREAQTWHLDVLASRLIAQHFCEKIETVVSLPNTSLPLSKKRKILLHQKYTALY